MRLAPALALLLAGCSSSPDPSVNPRLRAQPTAMTTGTNYQLRPTLDPHQVALEMGQPELEALIGMRVALAEEKLQDLNTPTPGNPPTPPVERDAEAQAIADQLTAEIDALRQPAQP